MDSGLAASKSAVADLDSSYCRTRVNPSSGAAPRNDEKEKGRALRHALVSYTAPAFCAYSQEAFASGTVRLADSMALALAAVPSRMRPAMPCVMPARRKRL